MQIFRRSLTLLVLVQGLCLLQAVTAAEIYKWTDAEGNVHFSTQPPPPASGADVSATGLSAEGKSGSVPLDLESSAWLVRKGHTRIKLTFSESGSYSWLETTSLPGYPISEKRKYGKYKLEGDRLTLTQRDANREDVGRSVYRATMQSADMLRLADINVSDEVYVFSGRPGEYRALKNEKERMISGSWAQVPYRAENRALALVRFESGIFYFFPPDASGTVKASTPESTYRAIASGKWFVEGDILQLDFWEAKGSMASRMLSQERWRITVLDHRRLQVTDEAGRKTQVFVRERTR